MDARDELHEVDSIGSDGPFDPPKVRTPRDPEQRKLVLLYLIAAATVVTAVGSGIAAWETHRSRSADHDLYCASYALDYETGEPAAYDDLDQSAKAIVDLLGCDLG